MLRVRLVAHLQRCHASLSEVRRIWQSLISSNPTKADFPSRMDRAVPLRKQHSTVPHFSRKHFSSLMVWRYDDALPQPLLTHLRPRVASCNSFYTQKYSSGDSGREDGLLCVLRTRRGMPAEAVW